MVNSRKWITKRAGISAKIAKKGVTFRKTGFGTFVHYNEGLFSLLEFSLIFIYFVIQSTLQIIMIIFNKFYFALTLLLFIIEFIIGAEVHDTIIRPYGGDFLVVILLYCLVKSFVNVPVFKTACSVLLFAYIVEVSQYFHLVNRLGLQHSEIAKILLGTCFSFTDLLSYTLGILLVIVVENVFISMKNF
jgi:hypothetical protein